MKAKKLLDGYDDTEGNRLMNKISELLRLILLLQLILDKLSAGLHNPYV